ncbi:MAG: hypothetical protein MKZ57_00530 [Candidatus Poseidoniaceae archaeon]|nr:hypothetical protein [Candidatus Poseidoniaceae archaeon]
MERATNKEKSGLAKFIQSPIFPILIFSFGAIIAIIETIYLLILGNSLENAVWPIAIRTLEITLILRKSVPSVTLLCAIILSLGLWLMIRGQQKKYIPAWVKHVLVFFSGLIFGLYAVFVIMDIRYLRGAFLLLPTLYGFILFSCAIGLRGIPKLPKSEKGYLDNFYSVSHLLTIFFAAWLMMPGLPALAGIAPSPPDKPAFGYGGQPGPFQEVLEIYPYPLPDNVTAIQGDTEEDITFSIYLSLPVLPENPGIEGVPLAIIFHAFNNPSRESYTDWIERLVGKGTVVAYVQYPTDVRPDGGEDWNDNTVEGTSDWPHHVPRLHSIYSALTMLNTIIDDETRGTQIDSVLGNLSIMPEHLYIGGHSLGGAYSLNALQMVQEFGWGNQTLVVNTEMAASRPVQDLWQPDFTGLPQATMVHLAVGEDDMTVGQCDSVYHQQLFNMIEKNNSLLIYIPSDKYGFPRLVASHYIPTNEAHDTLSDWAFYRRVDAQADWLVARSRGDYNTEQFAYSHLIDGPLLRDMGEWSDGTPVLQLQPYTNAIQENKFNDC